MMPTKTLSPIRIYGVPMDLGQRRRGVDMGPSAVRYAGLQNKLESLGYTVTDGGNIYAPVIEEIDDEPIDGLAHNVQSIVAVCTDVYQQVRESLRAGETTIILGGDHSISLGSVSAAADVAPNVGVLWVDAHGDFNTPFTTPSGNVHGMVVSSLVGLCPSPLMLRSEPLSASQFAYLGVRDLDVSEKVNMAASGALIRTMRDIDENGMASVVRGILNALSGCDALHISFDMDSLDPQVAEGVGTPVSGGLTLREAHLLMEMLADDGRVRSLDIVEINPILDNHNRTAQVAVDLIASLFGQRIL